MPHDCDGREIKQGDRVLIEFEVLNVTETESGLSNVYLRSVRERKDGIQEGFTCSSAVCELTEKPEAEEAAQEEAPPEVPAES